MAGEAVADRGRPVCGIIMPISATAECTEAHWLDVRHILSEAIMDAGFMPQMVSDAEDIGVIQKRIIQNIYNNPIVVCDVSLKNPNVMFELGMRLAFDKATIIVKDDRTTYSFDTSPIEHLEYPRDLRFPRIVEFKQKLVEKLKGTYQKATTEADYTAFLKHFGTFTVPVLETKEVSKEEYILEELKTLKSLVLRNRVQPTGPAAAEARVGGTLCLHGCSREQADAVVERLRSTVHLSDVKPLARGGNHYHISLADLDQDDRRSALACAKEIVERAQIVPVKQ